MTLSAERSTKRSFTDISAFAPGSYSERAPGFVEADQLSGGNRLLILRSVFDRLPSAAFTYAQDLSSATLDAPPGSSLAGSADFAKPHALTGDLTADFPGAVGIQSRARNSGRSFGPTDGAGTANRDL